MPFSLLSCCFGLLLWLFILSFHFSLLRHNYYHSFLSVAVHSFLIFLTQINHFSSKSRSFYSFVMSLYINPLVSCWFRQQSSFSFRRRIHSVGSFLPPISILRHLGFVSLLLCCLHLHNYSQFLHRLHNFTEYYYLNNIKSPFWIIHSFPSLIYCFALCHTTNF